MKERMHLPIHSQTGTRTLFFVDADNTNSLDIKNNNNYASMINKNDYSASHDFINSNQHVTFILYPSCRDPHQRGNAAILKIDHLVKNPKWESAINFFYDNAQQQINGLIISCTFNGRK